MQICRCNLPAVVEGCTCCGRVHVLSRGCTSRGKHMNLRVTSIIITGCLCQSWEKQATDVALEGFAKWSLNTGHCTFRVSLAHRPTLTSKSYFLAYTLLAFTFQWEVDLSFSRARPAVRVVSCDAVHGGVQICIKQSECANGSEINLGGHVAALASVLCWNDFSVIK